jgi:hypothetical protein
MQLFPIESYFIQRRRESTASVRLYAVVDGLLYADASGAVPTRSEAAIALFDGTPDAALADAGPWLFDFALLGATEKKALHRQGEGGTGVSWLISGDAFTFFADELRERLDAKMPSGGTALFRFYDARIMGNVAALFSFDQRANFFAPTVDWLVQVNGQLTRINSHA